VRGASTTSMIRHYVVLKAQVTGGNLGRGDPEAEGGGVQVGHVGVELGPRSRPG
jgi:hypothetical protein